LVLTNNLNTHQILTSRNTARDIESHLSLVLDKPIHTPGLVGGIQSVFVDFEPFQASDGTLKSAVDFCTRDKVRKLVVLL